MIISAYDIKNLKPISNARHKGQFGSCYIFNDKALKIIDRLDSIVIPFNIEQNLNELTKIQIEGVSLPLELVYCNNKFIGYVMPYFNGKTLTRVLLENNFKLEQNIIDKYFNTLINKIEILSDNYIKVNDIKPDNIIIYNNELCIVDCDFYRCCKNITKEEILKYNLEELRKGISKTTLPNKKDTSKILLNKINVLK